MRHSAARAVSAGCVAIVMAFAVAGCSSSQSNCIKTRIVNPITHQPEMYCPGGSNSGGGGGGDDDWWKKLHDERG